MTKIALIGASGFLGRKLWEMLSYNFSVIGTYCHNARPKLYPLDITSQKDVEEFIDRQRADVVIHAAAMSDVDACELDQKQAQEVNYQGTKNIVESCRRQGSKLIYISTIYVFDGKKGNYHEEDLCSPINVYGQTKLRAEREVSTLDNFTILRFDILYGFNGHKEQGGFFSKIISREEIKVNNDQKRQPLLADDVGHAIRIIIDENHSGTYHLAGPDQITKYQLGLALEEIVKIKSKLIPVAEEQQIARRPKNSSMDTFKARTIGIPLHSLSEGIAIIKRQYGTVTHFDDG